LSKQETTSPALAIDGLRTGQNYRVVFRSGRSVKEMVGTYLGLGAGGLQFNLRPLAGTTPVPAGDIIELWETSAKRRLPSKALSGRGEIRVF
jgi:hypothetical protein